MKQAMQALCAITLFFLLLRPAPAAELATVFTDNTCQITGVALSKDNRLFVTYPRWLPEHRHDVVEVLPGGRVRPYPDVKWNSWKPGDSGSEAFVCAQAVYVDDRDMLWVVDPANPAFGGVVPGANKLVQIDLKTDKVAKIFRFKKSVAGKNSYINDVRIDTERAVAYMTESAGGAIIVVDLKSGKARRLLDKDPSTQSDPAYCFRINGRELRNDKGPVKIHADGIALTPDGTYLYFKPLTDNKLYRIETKYLRDQLLPGAEIKKAVSLIGAFTTTDGMLCDNKGNLYLGDLENGKIIRLTPEGKQITIASDARLGWPDSYALSRDGWLYISDSQIQAMPWFNNGKSTRTRPYAVYKVKLP